MSRFKTELCNNLIELGSCKYGDRCHYAHGAHELRQVSRRHPKYRTERCKNFELTGKCPFGPRCSYVHPKPDLDSMIEQLTKYMKHTKAPKPDHEEDDDDVVSLFTRTNTSISTCDSILTNDDENKENQLVVKYQVSNKNQHHFTDNSMDLNNTVATNQVNNLSNIFSASVGSQKTLSSFSRTPLGSKNSTNILTSSMSISNQFQVNQSLIQANDQINSSISTVTTPTTANNGTCSSNLSFFEAASYESNKKLRLISTNPSNLNNTASNPFGISNPLSDYLNSTNINRRSPLHPKKQFYTRF